MKKAHEVSASAPVVLADDVLSNIDGGAEAPPVQHHTGISPEDYKALKEKEIADERERIWQENHADDPPPPEEEPFNPVLPML